MTVARVGQMVSVESLEEAAAALRERGLRVSDVRKVVLDSPEVVSGYCELETLAEPGLAHHVYHVRGLGLYALGGAVSAAATALLIALG